MGNKKGFTLVELLVTIGIIGILATVTVVSVGSARAKARDSKRLSDIKQIQSALELYNSDSGGYYPAGAAQDLGVTDGYKTICEVGFVTEAKKGDCASKYLDPVPADPTNTGNLKYKYTGKPDNCDNGAIMCSLYEIKFQLEAKSGALLPAVDITANPQGIQTPAAQ